MFKKIEQFMVFLFGADRKKRYLRILLLLGIITVCIIALQNVSCGYNKAGFYFKWEPIIDEIKVDKK